VVLGVVLGVCLEVDRNSKSFRHDSHLDDLAEVDGTVHSA